MILESIQISEKMTVIGPLTSAAKTLRRHLKERSVFLFFKLSPIFWLEDYNLCFVENDSGCWLGA